MLSNKYARVVLQKTLKVRFYAVDTDVHGMTLSVMDAAKRRYEVKKNKQRVAITVHSHLPLVKHLKNSCNPAVSH
jgi:endonuclease III